MTDAPPARGVQLFSFEGCPYAQRTRLTLLEKGLDFELVEIDLFNRPAWFPSVSPYGKVPVLRHAGGTVYESGIINQYLDEAFPQPPLLPATVLGRARARIWMDYCDTRFLPAASAVTAAGSSNDEARRQAAVAAFSQVLRFLDREGLGSADDSGPFFCGQQLTLVDIHYLPFFERFGTYQALGGAEWPAECIRLRRWLDTLQTRASYQATARSTEYHLEQRRQMLAGRPAPA
jgi:glutathione S-transferase